MRLFVILSLCVAATVADVYMHNPRGSNNRLNENTATRKQDNRLFDSQNNARGGYNVGDQSKSKSNNEQEQYRMKYFQGTATGVSELVIEWTNQHGCGGNENTDPHKQNCDMVIQAMCQPVTKSGGTYVQAPADQYTIRNGQNTNQQAFTNVAADSNKAAYNAQIASDVDNNKGLHEAWDYYNDCSKRQRNKGLFTADQTLTNDQATSTRQNPNANRNGYECPEERDYFPYFHPTPWMDVAILTDHPEKCTYYEDNSFNRNAKHLCIENFAGGGPRYFSEHNNKNDCEAANGEWTAFYQYIHINTDETTKAGCDGITNSDFDHVWGKPYDTWKIQKKQAIAEACLAMPPKIDCKDAPWSRSNHLGNGRDGVPLNYTWSIPHFKEDKQCVLRLRYNISTDDYDPFNTDASSNGASSPITNNPLVSVGENNAYLQLAINTAQTGRTFQDRSHVFILQQRTAAMGDRKIHNLNVRGKRGNIVQTFPAVEYDFIPNRLEVASGNDLVHIQWTGSNSHNNGAPGGDGQTGDAGEGTGGTDRTNILQSKDADQNWPVPFEYSTMWEDVTVYWDSSGVSGNNINEEGLALRLASVGEYWCMQNTDAACNGQTQKSVEGRPAVLSNLLNDAPASYPGMVVQFDKAGVYHYLCTRNNNFTNRSQKGKITVKA